MEGYQIVGCGCYVKLSEVFLHAGLRREPALK